MFYLYRSRGRELQDSLSDGREEKERKEIHSSSLPTPFDYLDFPFHLLLNEEEYSRNEVVALIQYTL